MVAVKHMVAVACVVGAIATPIVGAGGCAERPPAAPTPASTGSCMMISKPVAPRLVQISAAGVRSERPLLRPACTAVQEGVVAWADERGGVHVDVDGVVFDVAGAEQPIGGGCLSGVVVGHHLALVGLATGPTLIDGGVARPFALPPLAAGERVTAVRRGGAVVVGHHATRASRVVGVDGQPDLRVLGPRGVVAGRVDGNVIVLDDGRRIDAGEPVRAASVRGNVVIASLRRSTVGWLGVAEVARLKDTEVLWAARSGKSVLVDRAGTLIEIDGAGERVRVAIDDAARDLAGQPFAARERTSWAYDARSDALLVSERVRDDDCTIRDNVVVIDSAGGRRLVASGPGARRRLSIGPDGIAYAEYQLSYEPMADGVGTVDVGAFGAVGGDNGANVP